MRKCSLQINLAPVDFPFAKYILPYQLKKLAKYFDEVLLIVDLHKSKGRFSGVDWELNKDKLDKLISEQLNNYPNVALKYVDYSEESQALLSDYFTSNKFKIPFKDNRGGPYYSYLFGLIACENDYVFHLDSDMLLMGDPGYWLKESIDILVKNEKYLACCPANSPFSSNKEYKNAIGKNYGIDLNGFTTRFFLMDRRRIQGQFRRKLPPLDRIINALIKGNSFYQAPEKSLDRFMERERLNRIEFPGEGGFIAIHPSVRSKIFFNNLPKIISLLKQDKYPDAQKGECNLTDEFIHMASMLEK